MIDRAKEKLRKLALFAGRDAASLGPVSAWVIYALFAMAFTFPLAGNFFSHVIGHQEGDMWKHLWGFWWVRAGILRDGAFPLFTTLINYPYGGGLFFIDPLGALLSMPLQVFLTPAAAYNAMAFFNVVFAAFCAYLLANHFVKDRAAALYGGAAYAFSAYALSYLSSGVSETFNSGWLPLFLYFFIKMLAERTWKFVFPSAITLFLCTLGSWYYGMFAALLGIFAVAAWGCHRAARAFRLQPSPPLPAGRPGRTVKWLQVKAKRLWHRKNFRYALTYLTLSLAASPFLCRLSCPPGMRCLASWASVTGALALCLAIAFALMRARFPLKGFNGEPGGRLALYAGDFFLGPVRKALAMSVISLTLIVPVFQVFAGTTTHWGALVSRERGRESMGYYLSGHFHNVSRLIDYVKPGKESADRTYTVDRLTRSSYAGWITLLLAVAAPFAVRRRRFLWLWVFAAGFFTLFSLGPFLYTQEGRGLSRPFFLYLWFYDHFPFFTRISIPYRFSLAALLAFSVLSAFTLSALFRGWSRSRRSLAALVLGIALLFEVMLLSPGPWPVPLSGLQVPPVYGRMAADSGDYGIIDVPILRGKGELSCGEYFYYQMTHGKGIPYTVEGTIPAYLYENQLTLQLYRQERGLPAPSCREQVLEQYAGELYKNRIPFIVVHDNYLTPLQKNRIHPFLGHFFGPPADGGMGLKVYSTRRARAGQK